MTNLVTQEDYRNANTVMECADDFEMVEMAEMIAAIYEEWNDKECNECDNTKG